MVSTKSIVTVRSVVLGFIVGIAMFQWYLLAARSEYRLYHTVPCQILHMQAKMCMVPCMLSAEHHWHVPIQREALLMTPVLAAPPV